MKITDIDGTGYASLLPQSACPCVIVIAWSQLVDHRLYNHMRSRVIIDESRVYDPSELRSGSVYRAISFRKAVKV